MGLGKALDGVRSFFAGSSRGPSVDDVIKMPAHVVYVHWGFGAPVGVMEWDLTIDVDPGSTVGEYLALFNGSIDGSQCYLGLQTNIRNPELGQGVGKGLIFSTWWSFDEANTRIADDGFRELGTHEGTFVGVRRNYEWAAGSYRVTLARGDADATGARNFDWFDLSIARLEVGVGGRKRESEPRSAGGTRPTPTGSSEWIGALRFPRRSPDRPAMIEPGGVLFMEVYGDARTWADVPPWHVDVMAFGDGERCPAGRTEYPRYPHGQLMPNANTRHDPERGVVSIAIGRDVVMNDPPRPWR